MSSHQLQRIYVIVISMLATFVIVLAALLAESRAHSVRMTEDDAKMCASTGDCVVVSLQGLAAQVAQWEFSAWALGRQSCARDDRNSV